jgi:hypothetical protein
MDKGQRLGSVEGWSVLATSVDARKSNAGEQPCENCSADESGNTVFLCRSAFGVQTELILKIRVYFRQTVQPANISGKAFSWPTGPAGCLDVLH